MQLSKFDLSISSYPQDWLDGYIKDGVAPTLILDFENGRYFNQTLKAFSELLTTSGTTIDSDGIHVGAGDTLEMITVNDGGTDVPFYGFDGDKGTWVFVGNWVEHGGDSYMLAGDAVTRVMYQGASLTAIRSYDGSDVLSRGGVFTDNTDIVLVVSYLKGGNFNLLTDGGTEDSGVLTGDFYTPTFYIGNLAGSNPLGGFVRRVMWYPEQLSLAARQSFTT